MKQKIQYIPLIATALGLLTGCAASRGLSGKAVTATPAPYVLTPDSTHHTDLNMTFHIPEHYLSRRSRLVILPQLVRNDTVYDEYTPLVVDAPVYTQKTNRKKVLDNYTDPYEEKVLTTGKKALELPYRESLQLPENMDGAQILAVITTDGCGACTGIDTLQLATISCPAPVIVEPVRELAWMEPEFVIRPKVVNGKGVARLQFGISRSDINLSLGHNRQELENMVQTLSPILSDTLATLTAITITGMASADGSLAYNNTLSRNRANAAREWFLGQLRLNPEVQRLIAIDSRPEGWEPVLAAMTAAGDKDSVDVKGILTKYSHENDDVQERFIRRLPCWSRIKGNYLQKDRKVEYIYSYTLKSFTTDAELMDMYGKRPDAFNEEELLRVATLAATPDKKIEVYKTLLKYFPGSHVATNNLAVLYVQQGKMEEAKQVLGVTEKLVIRKAK